MLHVLVGEDTHSNLARVREAMEALQQGRRPKPHFAVRFAEVGQMLAILTPKRGADCEAARDRPCDHGAACPHTRA